MTDYYRQQPGDDHEGNKNTLELSSSASVNHAQTRVPPRNAISSRPLISSIPRKTASRSHDGGNMWRAYARQFRRPAVEYRSGVRDTNDNVKSLPSTSSLIPVPNPLLEDPNLVFNLTNEAYRMADMILDAAVPDAALNAAECLPPDQYYMNIGYFSVGTQEDFDVRVTIPLDAMPLANAFPIETPPASVDTWIRRGEVAAFPYIDRVTEMGSNPQRCRLRVAIQLVQDNPQRSVLTSLVFNYGDLSSIVINSSWLDVATVLRSPNAAQLGNLRVRIISF